MTSSSTTRTVMQIANTSVSQYYMIQVVGSGVTGREGNLEIWGNNPGFIGFTVSAAGNTGIGTYSPGYRLQVGNAGDGTQARANSWGLLSDIRYKTDIEVLTGALEKISGINGFYFHWNTGIDKTRQFGLSAQDVEKVLPEVVSTGEDGYMSVDYGKLVPLLVEGMKEQQQQIDRLEKIIMEMQTKIASSSRSYTP
jgi:hypothetical protein